MTRTLSVFELKHHALWIEEKLYGGQLQDLWTDGEVLVLQLYNQNSYWLCFDLNSSLPRMILLTSRPLVEKKVKPVTLFLHSHGKNLRLKKLIVHEEMGRVLKMEFSSFSGGEVIAPCRCEIFLIPKNANFKVEAENEKGITKSVYFFKPKVLPTYSLNEKEIKNKKENLMVVTGNPDSAVGQETYWLEYANQWLKERMGDYQTNHEIIHGKKRDSAPANATRREAENQIRKRIEKNSKAIEKISQQNFVETINKYHLLGENLKCLPRDGDIDSLPFELKDLYDLRLSHSENIERAFQKVKSLKTKQEGAFHRIEVLKKEIKDWQNQLKEGTVNTGNPVGLRTFLRGTDVKMRKLVLAEGFQVLLGKSAKDNLDILRRARAWDLWFHLRDYPGAHAILLRDKKSIVSDSVLIRVGQWLLRESFGKKTILSGVKYVAIVTECRYVKPIKGAPGLVTYQNERRFQFQLP